MTVQIDWTVAGDADLVGAATAVIAWLLPASTTATPTGSTTLCGMVGDRDAAADCVQEAFCMAAVDLPTLRDPAKLRPWLYSIARHQRCGPARRRRETTSMSYPTSRRQMPVPTC